MSSSSGIRNILDLPDEILVEIILYLIAGERLALADSCKRLNSIVFGYRAVLRDLDFSKRGHLTTAANIQRYFSKEATRHFTMKVNIENVHFRNAGHILNNSIGRAINLVDINILGTEFENFERLGSFLAPLLHLQRLSLNWPESENAEFDFNRGILQKPLSRLKYLSLVINPHYGTWPAVVELCLELEELRMVIMQGVGVYRRLLSSEPIKLKNLRVIQLRGPVSDLSSVKKDLMCLLKIDEAKKLLKDPEYQVSYLHFNHTIEHDCDAHLVASAFPNVNELVFHIINSKDSAAQCQNRKRPVERRLRKKGSMAPEKEDDATNPESSFKMLVENTPRVESLKILSSFVQEDEWLDLDWLCLIPLWKNLRVIIFKEIPFENGDFLIGIGKECKELEEVQLLFPLGLHYTYCYSSGLVQMLNQCRNLKKFSIEQDAMDNMSEVFKSLTNKHKLETVRMTTRTEKCDSRESISSIEHMLHRCPRLTKFFIKVLSKLNHVDVELRPGLERIVGKLNRPNFVLLGSNFPREAVYEDTSTSFLSSPLDRIIY